MSVCYVDQVLHIIWSVEYIETIIRCWNILGTRYTSNGALFSVDKSLETALPVLASTSLSVR